MKKWHVKVGDSVKEVSISKILKKNKILFLDIIYDFS